MVRGGITTWSLEADFLRIEDILRWRVDEGLEGTTRENKMWPLTHLSYSSAAATIKPRDRD